MRVCRTLDYIVNTDLHLYLFVKFDNARNKGIQVEIELTEPIVYLPVDSVDYIDIVDLILDDVTCLLAESKNKKMNFYMFYTDGELHLVIEYPFGKECSSKKLDTVLRHYDNFHFFTAHEKGVITQHLIVTR